MHACFFENMPPADYVKKNWADTLHLSSHERYYFYNQAVDMRKGCYGLYCIVQNELKKNVLNGDVFVFINKRHNQIKLLQLDRDGFALYEKRLEKDTFD